MSRVFGGRIVFTVLAALPLISTSGCLIAPGAAGADAFGMDPGTYFVEQRSDKLFAFQLPEVRGEEGQWIEITERGLPFNGQGLYRLSNDFEWAQEAAGVTLDEVIQLHDPPPAAPAADTPR